MTRIFHHQSLNEHSEITLNDSAYAHAIRVLRMKVGETFILFDGSNRVFEATLIAINKKSACIAVGNAQYDDRESPLYIHLGQVISRGEKMDLTIQKSVELGVSIITPLFSERCGVKLSGDRLSKRIEQWQKMVISACEQCGRNQIPTVKPAMNLEQWCANLGDSLKLNLHPRASQSLNTLVLPNNHISLLIGPEGGLSPKEITMTSHYQFTDILLGPRVLRTETAALTALAALQTKFGDLS